MAAQRFLAAVGPTTTVRVADNVTVAGRAAYQLELAPKSSQSLIGQVAIAVDAATPDLPFPRPPHQRLHLRGHPSGLRCHKLAPRVHLGMRRCLILFPHGPHMTNPVSPEQYRKLTRGGRGAPAFGLARPDQLRGRPGSVPCKPQGPQIHLKPKGCLPQKKLARPDQLRGCQAGWSAYSPATGLTDPGPCTRRTLGSSWTTVVAFPAGTGNQTTGPLGLLLRAAKPVQGSWGSGRLLTTSLLSVLVTSDGRVLAGAVTPDTLYADAAQLKAP